MKKTPSDIKVIAKNKKAFFEYHIEEKIEAGLVLMGSEVKSLRDNRASLSDAYVIVKGGEAFLLSAHIAPYGPASDFGHEQKRTRKLLLHRKEIDKISSQLKEKGLSMVPTMIYFRKGRAKVELGLGRGKKKHDKRETIKKRESDRDMRRALRKNNR
jgi:SsrA-binding protein